MRIKPIPYLMTAALVTAMNFYGSFGCAYNNQHEAQVSEGMHHERVLEEERENPAQRPFATAEEYHLNSEFDDARNWHIMIVEDFPELESLVERIDDPYSEIKYNAQAALESEPFSETYGELIEMHEELRALIGG